MSSLTQRWGHLPECVSLTNHQSAYYHVCSVAMSNKRQALPGGSLMTVVSLQCGHSLYSVHRLPLPTISKLIWLQVQKNHEILFPPSFPLVYCVPCSSVFWLFPMARECKHAGGPKTMLINRSLASWGGPLRSKQSPTHLHLTISLTGRLMTNQRVIRSPPKGENWWLCWSAFYNEQAQALFG